MRQSSMTCTAGQRRAGFATGRVEQLSGRMKPRTTLGMPDHNTCRSSMWALASALNESSTQGAVLIYVSRGTDIGNTTAPVGGKTSQAGNTFTVAFCHPVLE